MRNSESRVVSASIGDKRFEVAVGSGKFDLTTERVRMRAARATALILEFGIYAVILFSFRSDSLRTVALFAVLAALIARWFCGATGDFSHLKHPIVVATLMFAGVTLISILWSPDVAYGAASFISTIGVVVLLLVSIPIVFDSQEKQRRLLLMMAFAGVYLNVIEISHYAQDYQTGTFLALNSINRYRSYADSLVLYFPFVLMAAIYGGRAKYFWWIVVLVELALLAMTGARGAWVGLAVSIIVCLLLTGSWRIALTAVLAIAALYGLAVISPHYLIPGWTTARAWSADMRYEIAWAPTLQAIFANPIWGYGYGDWFSEQGMSRLLNLTSWWTGSAGMGPHNNYLQTWVLSGLPALAALILLYAKFTGRIVAFIRTAPPILPRYLALASLMSFIAEYLIRGFVESMTWRHLGLLLGIGVAVLLSHPARVPLDQVDEASRSRVED